MSRYSPDIDREKQPHHASPQQEFSSARGAGGGAFSTDLASIIDEAATGSPTFSQLLVRLEARGVTPIPSVNARGLNGISYRFRGRTVRGSDIGRAYTAQGLRDRKGVQYLPDRDDPAIKIALGTFGDARTIGEFERYRTPGSRVSRIRDVRSGLSLDQQATLAEIGMFRTVSVADLIEHRYSGNYRQFDQDSRILRDAGLIERRTAAHLKSGRTFNVIVLTKRGRTTAWRAARCMGSSQLLCGLCEVSRGPARYRHLPDVSARAGRD